MYTLKLRKVGTSTGVVLPKELLAQLRATEGQEVFAVESPNGFTLSVLNPRVRQQVQLGEAFMDRYRDTFAALAK